MLAALISCSVSLVLAILFALFLRKEAREGVRRAPHIRGVLDHTVVGVQRFLSRVIGSWARHMARQVFHYVFHTMLVVMSRVLRRAEHALRELIRANRSVARKSEQEQVRSSTLDEVMLHKIAVSLTEEEKKAHRERSLRGH